MLSYKGHRYPVETINHCVWLYFRFPLSFREVEEIDVLVQSRRHGNAAKRFFRKLLKGVHYVPRVIVTDKLASYQVARREMLASVEHRRSKYLNNRAENSHQPTRQREHAMKRFTSPGHAQRFLSAFGGISPHFRPKPAPAHSARMAYREMADRFADWQEATATDAAAKSELPGSVP